MKKNDFAVNTILKMITFYKKGISPYLGNNCRYIPSCSQYTYEAVEKYGVFKGISKGIFRIMRCNPFSKGGYDPLR